MFIALSRWQAGLFVELLCLVLSFADENSRTSKGNLYLMKRFIPSDQRFYLGLHRVKSRLHCLKFCQDVSSCQTVMYDQLKQDCHLFSEHLQFGRGRLIDENNKHLVVIRLDKDSLATTEPPSTTLILPASFPKAQKTCEHCDL